MIAFIEGAIEEVHPTHAVINAGGMGYEVRISLVTFGEIKAMKQVRLHTYFHVKEDSQTLYGFLEPKDKDLFILLISVSGIGPSTALMMFSSLSAEEIREAISLEQVHIIKGVKGIGAKTAQRLILELKDKVYKDLPDHEDTGQKFGGMSNTIRNEALSALVTLGIPKPQAEKSLDLVLKEYEGTPTLEDLIKLALKRS